MIRFRPFLIAALLCIAFPAASVASVFSCPDVDEITMTENKDAPDDRRWQASLKKLPKGMPALFANARFISNGKYAKDSGATKSLHSSDMPIKIHFHGAMYLDDSTLTYACAYIADNSDYSGLLILLQLSDIYIPESNEMPLLLMPAGKHWQRYINHRGALEESITFKACEKSAKDCAFHLPWGAVRSKTDTPNKYEGKEALLIQLIADPYPYYTDDDDCVSYNQNIFKTYFSESNSVQHSLINGLRESTTFNYAQIDLYDHGYIDINEFTKAREGNEDNQKCNLDSRPVAKCSCSSTNFLKMANAKKGHVMVDLFAAYDDKHKATNAACSLFFIPGSTRQPLLPHKHSERHGGEL
ncbi:hypothetical protein GZ77_18250 [Endozoicomonas montiporae]|uniref:Uncharacterized protein n=3 Tax=Endozoicomonas montiporae TaxID=1027273 RepID=A0A081N1Z1_9GAMM|nr:hypothetical protein [Endozoicomonas montiporae]AMO58584.1 hypothetical protein EZMO1_4679 [Endozoicomonas montiporae CL-33]KEQ12464.1 hypothetical protein GZ77_18250 [Endozoicomonas montiporae]